MGSMIVALAVVAVVAAPAVLYVGRRVAQYHRAVESIAAAAGLEIEHRPTNRVAEPPDRPARGNGEQTIRTRLLRREDGRLRSFVELRSVRTGGDQGLNGYEYTVAFAPASGVVAAADTTLPDGWTFSSNELVACIRVHGWVEPSTLPELLDAVERSVSSLR